MAEKMIRSMILGDLTLTGENTYTCESDWLGNTVTVVMPAEGDVPGLLGMLEDFFTDCEGWDRHLRANAAEQLFYMAQELDPSLTEEEFARRIKPQQIQIFDSGTVCVFFSDDNMLKGMRVTVYAELD